MQPVPVWRRISSNHNECPVTLRPETWDKALEFLRSTLKPLPSCHTRENKARGGAYAIFYDLLTRIDSTRKNPETLFSAPEDVNTRQHLLEILEILRNHKKLTSLRLERKWLQYLKLTSDTVATWVVQKCERRYVPQGLLQKSSDWLRQNNRLDERKDRAAVHAGFVAVFTVLDDSQEEL